MDNHEVYADAMCFIAKVKDHKQKEELATRFCSVWHDLMVTLGNAKDPNAKQKFTDDAISILRMKNDTKGN